MNVYIRMVIIVSFFLLPGCGKDFLNVKSERSQVVPTTIKDLWAILDYTSIMNSASGHTLGEMSTDDYFVDPALLPLLSNPEQRNAYLWKPDLYEGKEGIADWNGPFSVVLHANIVLERLEGVERNQINEAEWGQVRGTALFFRSWSFLSLAQGFCRTYDAATSNLDLGIPLRLESDVSIRSRRASVAETYQQIETDILEAANLLPDRPLVKTRPSRAAAFALLSRIYLIKGQYDLALEMADKCLSLYNDLLNYNEMDTTARYPFSIFNDEVIFHSNMSSPAILGASRLYVSPTLYNQYEDQDLRKVLFFLPGQLGYHYKGSYRGSAAFFTGLATSEVLLNRAEARARTGQYEEAMSDLNHLLQFRYAQGSFINREASNPEEALSQILQERRKELVFRGIRWTDIRRLNKEPQYARTLQREVAGEWYSLPPNDARYVFPIPDEVIRLTGMQQNER